MAGLPAPRPGDACRTPYPPETSRADHGPDEDPDEEETAVRHDEVPDLDEQLEIEAPAPVVWALVADVTRMADWSPQVTSTRLAEPDAAPRVGTRFTNRNTHGEDMTWTTHAEITRYDEGRALAFRIDENHTTWSFEVEPVGEGRTLLRQRRAAPEGISDLSRELTDAFLGGQEAFTASQRAGMRATLERIRAEAETAMP